MTNGIAWDQENPALMAKWNRLRNSVRDFWVREQYLGSVLRLARSVFGTLPLQHGFLAFVDSGAWPSSKDDHMLRMLLESAGRSEYHPEELVLASYDASALPDVKSLFVASVLFGFEVFLATSDLKSYVVVDHDGGVSLFTSEAKYREQVREVREELSR